MYIILQFVIQAEPPSGLPECVYARLFDSYLPQSMLRLFLNAHHNGSLPVQLEVVWILPLQAGSEGPTLIFCTVTHTLY